MKTKACELCRCTVTPTYAMKHLDEFANLVCTHDATLQEINIDLDLKAPINNPVFTGTVQGISKGMVGLSNVDNTSDANKPVSIATQTAINLKANINAPSFTGIANFSSSNINNRRVALNSDLLTIVNSNSFVGLVLVDSDSTNDNLPTMYLVFNNTYFWIPTQQM